MREFRMLTRNGNQVLFKVRKSFFSRKIIVQITDDFKGVYTTEDHATRQLLKNELAAAIYAEGIK